jgi:hypothetical protein
MHVLPIEHVESKVVQLVRKQRVMTARDVFVDLLFSLEEEDDREVIGTRTERHKTILSAAEKAHALLRQVVNGGQRRTSLRLR